MKIRIFSAALSLCLAGPAFGQVKINETFVNAPGTDQGTEFFELYTASPSYSLAGLTFLVLEGDGTGAGTIDAAFSLGSFSSGANGLFLWRDTAAVLTPAPDALTSINVADFTPDLENGSLTFLIVQNFTGTIGTDLDAANDGILDSTPWSGVLDAIGVLESDGAANVGYGASLGFANFPQFTFTPDAVYRLGDGGNWYGSDVLGTAPGPFDWAAAEQGDLAGVSQGLAGYLTPGSANVAVPEPSVLAFAGMGFGILLVWGRKLKK